jgi:hypothetical protein
MREFTFLIPIVRDTNKAAHSQFAWDWLETVLGKAYGGFTYCGEVQGHWLENGVDCFDTSRKYLVCGETDKLLRGIIGQAKLNFDQQCIYLAETASNVELV